MVFVNLFLDRLAFTHPENVNPYRKGDAMMAKRALSSQFVTVCVSVLFFFSAPAANLSVGYQTGIDPSKVPQADGLYEKTIDQKIDWRRFNSGPEVVTAITCGDVQIGNLGSSPLAAGAQVMPMGCTDLRSLGRAQGLRRETPGGCGQIRQSHSGFVRRLRRA